MVELNVQIRTVHLPSFTKPYHHNTYLAWPQTHQR